MIEYFFILGALISLVSVRAVVIFSTSLLFFLFKLWFLPVKFTITVIGIFSLIFSYRYFDRRKNLKLFYLLMNLFIFSVLFFISATNWIVLFIAWESMNWISYFLIKFNKTPASQKAARNTLIINSFGSLSLLSAILINYSVSGTFTFLELIPVSAYFILFAALIKSAIFPFSFWLLDAMEAPTPASALIHSSTMVGAGALLIFKFSSELFYLSDAIKFIALISFFITSLAALKERNQKRILAYSTLSSMALMFYIFDSPLFVPLFVIHSFVKAAMFFLVGTYAKRENYILELGLEKRSLTSVLMGFSILSLMGFPPFGLFWIKSSLGTLLLGAIMFFITALYLLRFYFKTFSGGIKPEENMSTKLATILLVLSVFFTIPLFTKGFEIFATVFVVLFFIAVQLYSLMIFEKIAIVFEKILRSFGNFKLQNLSFDFDEAVYSFGKKVTNLSNKILKIFTGSFKDDVIYIVLSLFILMLGVLLF